MRSISFSFNYGVSDMRREQILKEIEDWPEIEKAGALQPATENPDILRMATAYPADQADELLIVAKLRSMPEIEFAAIPSNLTNSSVH